MTRWVLPRLLAPILLGGGDIIIGWTRAAATNNAHVAAYQKVGILTISTWGWVLVAVGAFALFGMIDWRIAYASMFVSLGYWLMWSSFLFQAHHDVRVSPTGWENAVWIATLHILLAPYLRRFPLPDLSRRTGPE